MWPTDRYAKRLEDLDRSLIDVKAFAGRWSSKMAAGNVSSSAVMNAYASMRGVYKNLDAVKTYAASDPDFIAYIRDQKADASLNVAAEFNAVLSAIDDVVTEIQTAFPTYETGGNTYLLAQTWGNDRPVDREFTPAQTSNIQTKLDAVVAAIN